MVSVAIDSTPYYWRSRDIFVDLPLRVAVAARRPRTNSCEVIYDVRVMCSREWHYIFDDADALSLDTSDEYAATVLRANGDPKKVDYNVMFTQLASILVGKYVIVDDYKAFGEILRLELQSYCFFDVVTNILVRKEALRRGGHFWQRSRNVVAPLSEMWSSFFDTPLDLRNTAAVASGLRLIFMNVEQQYAHNNFIPASPTAAICPWRSTPTAIHLLTVSFNMERQSARYRARSCYSSREQQCRRFQLKSVVLYRFEIDVCAQLDPMSSKTINALIREHAVAGVARLRLLSEQHIDVDAVIKRFRDVYDEHARRHACDILEFRIDLRRAAHAAPSGVAAAFCSLLRLSDAEIETLARRFELAGLYYPSGLGLVPIQLIEFVDHRFLS